MNRTERMKAQRDSGEQSSAGLRRRLGGLPWSQLGGGQRTVGLVTELRECLHGEEEHVN